MLNITKKFIIILGAIVFSFAISSSASAYYGHYAYSTDPVGYQADYGYQQPIISNNPIYPSYYSNPQPQYVYVQQPATTTTTTTKPTVVNNYYYQTAPAKTTTTTTNTTTNTTSGTPTYIPATTTSTVPANTGSTLGASAYNPYAQTYQTTGNGITALSLRGSGSFMPSSIWQWIITVILILIIIIVARMFIRKPDPADHDVHIHNAPAH